MKRYNRNIGGEWHFLPDDEMDGLLLRAHGNLYFTDWGEWVDYGPGFFPDVPEIEVSQILPEGGLKKVGVLGEDGIFDVITHSAQDGTLTRIDVIYVANWSDIETLDLELPRDE